MEYSCKCILNDDELGGKSYVGIFKNANDYSVVTPYGLILPDTINSTEREKIEYLKKYARCITKALSKDKTRRYLQENCEGKNNPLSALNVVLDYVQNGPYREFETETVIREAGKIDFKKTISRVKPMIINDEALYTNFAITRKKVSSQEIVNLAQGNVINHFMENGGEVLFGNLIHIAVPKIALNSSLVAQLRVVKANSFNSRKQQLIQWIIDYIQGAVNKKEVGSWQYSIVASTLWEEMIDACYSNQAVRDKTKYGTTFTFYSKGKAAAKTPKTEHDTIFETEKDIVIIDAKMYPNLARLASHTAVIEKQFNYAFTAKHKNPDKKVYNVLIKPLVASYGEQEGFISDIPYFENDTDPERMIFVYAVPFVKVLDAYYGGQKLGTSFVDELKSYLSQKNDR